MLFQPHISDQELMLSADGELPPRRTVAVRDHLERCWECRTRFAELQSAIGNFIHLRDEQFESGIPPGAGPRSLLKAKLRELSGAAGEPAAARIVSWFNAHRSLACLAVAIMVAVIYVSLKSAGRNRLAGLQDALITEGAMPRPSLTPGETVVVTPKDVCTPNFPTEKQMVIPGSLQQRVFQQYGISDPNPDAFEVDYLITPDLGGASSERNLWPEPYHSVVWNARVKDELEVHLKNLVCSGKLEISTAQHELATDWVSAYKRYFRTDVPLGEPRNLLTLLARLDDRQRIDSASKP